MPRQKKCPHRYVDDGGLCKDCRQPVDLSEHRNKYGAKRKDGFDSTAEARRYRELRLMEKAGEIERLSADKKILTWRLEVNGIFIGSYEADFSYRDVSSGERVIEDVKGVRTREFIIKKRLMLACHGIDVREVKA